MLPRWSTQIGTLATGNLADVLLVEGDVSRDITLLQKPSRLRMVMKGGMEVDITTPIAPRRVWAYERHQMFLPGYFRYDEVAHSGHIVD
jgi:hypothetical protein